MKIVVLSTCAYVGGKNMEMWNENAHLNMCEKRFIKMPQELFAFN